MAVFKSVDPLIPPLGKAGSFILETMKWPGVSLSWETANLPGAKGTDKPWERVEANCLLKASSQECNLGEVPAPPFRLLLVVLVVTVYFIPLFIYNGVTLSTSLAWGSLSGSSWLQSCDNSSNLFHRLLGLQVGVIHTQFFHFSPKG